MKDDIQKKWFNNGHILINLIILSILAIIICSQSFANAGEGSFALLSSVLNHNSVYLLTIVYFVLLKFSFGKRYFNYLNVFLVFLYFFVSTTSLLTVFQSFNLSTVLSFSLNVVFLVYLIHTMFRDSRIWKEFHLGNSPFNELSNEWFYYAIVTLTIFLLAVNLISTVVFSGVVLSVLDAFYFILFGRFIYLYRFYLDQRKLDSENKGNFDTVREKVQEVLDKTEIDDKISEGAKDLKNKVDTFIQENEFDKKMENIKSNIADIPVKIKEEVSESTQSNEIPKENKKKTSKKSLKEGEK